MLVWVFLETEHPHRDKHWEKRHADVLPSLEGGERPERDKEMTLLFMLVLIELHPQLMLNNSAKQELDQDVQHRNVQKGTG